MNVAATEVHHGDAGTSREYYVSEQGFGSDVRRFFETMLGLGKDETIGNAQLRDELDWSQRGRFERARDTLVAAGVVKVLRGDNGGRLSLRSSRLPSSDKLDVATERGLYVWLVSPLHSLLQEGDPHNVEDDATSEDVAVVVSAEQGLEQTGARFSRPDLVGVVRRRLMEFDAVEIHGFEVKPYWSTDRTGVYEAVAQRALGLVTHAWVVYYLPDERVALRKDARTQVDAGVARLERLKREAADRGVGLAVCRHVSDDGMEHIVQPTRYGADPRCLDEFLKAAAPDLLEQVGIEGRPVVV